jgi:hypothetical protein
VAIVTGPAYPQTTVEVRAMAASLTEDGSAADKTQADEGASSEDRLANRKRKIDILRRL